MNIVIMLSMNWPELSTEKATPISKSPVNTLYGVQNKVDKFLFEDEVVYSHIVTKPSYVIPFVLLFHISSFRKYSFINIITKF